jgi:hypothetical protein
MKGIRCSTSSPHLLLLYILPTPPLPRPHSLESLAIVLAIDGEERVLLLVRGAGVAEAGDAVVGLPVADEEVIGAGGELFVQGSESASPLSLEERKEERENAPLPHTNQSH